MWSWSGLSYLESQSSLTMCRLNLKLKTYRWDPDLVCHTLGGQSSLTIHRLKLTLNILGEIRVWSVIPGGSIIFDHVQTKSELKNFRWDPGLVCHTLGGQSSLTMHRLKLNLKILGEILVWSDIPEGQSSLTMHRLKLNLKILGADLVWSVIEF